MESDSVHKYMLDMLMDSYMMSPMKINIEINCDNAAFGETADEQAAELKFILGWTASKLEIFGLQDYAMRDRNGNIVGKLIVTKD